MGKFIFLDIDGVLNSMDFLHLNVLNARVNKTDFKGKDIHGHLFDPRCVLALDCLIKATDADIVITSDWRFAGLDAMKQLWSDRGLPGNIVGITSFSGGIRGQDIYDYMRINDIYPVIDKYLIIDDDSDFLDSQLPHFIQTGFKFGLSFDDVLKGIDILNKNNT